MAAAQSIFALPELLENDVIDASPTLQRKLFLAADDRTEIQGYDFNLIFFFGEESVEDAASKTMCPPGGDQRCLSAPFLYDLSKMFFDCSLRAEWNESWERMHITQPPSTKAAIYLDFVYEHPGHAAGECDEEYECNDYYEGDEEIVIHRPDGVRISDIMDMFAELWEMNSVLNMDADIGVMVPKIVQTVTEPQIEEIRCSRSSGNWCILGEGKRGRDGRIWCDELHRSWIGAWEDPRGSATSLRKIRTRRRFPLG
ncbi:hypothetical protein LTR37_001582 [Vermiconidia calcicola]|uniref:Uncharacterized protein n=1 Tax=Vermiconidia calcicola TaxID=1690605 RepID=A0ACC3NVG6_9PEZI|nr:hypothetical protein LTR37_001582 [Vermiconidia calcicola]